MKLYRYEDGSIDSKGNAIIRDKEFKVISETDKSYRIETGTEKLSESGEWIKATKTVRKSGKNLFAFNSKGKALNNYIARKDRHVKILSTNLEMAKFRREQALRLKKINP